MSSMASWPLRENFLDAGEPATSFPPVLNRITQVLADHIWPVTAYGAVGDGVADDTAEIQAAIDAAADGFGGAVYLPKGTYKVSSAILLKDKVRLIGANRDASIIKAAAGFLSNVDVAQNTTTLTAAISTTSETSISVAGASNFPLHGTYKIKIDSEILYVTAGHGTTTWTVTRGQDSTTAATHSNGATVKEVISRVVELGNGISDAFQFAFGAKLVNLTVDANSVANTTAVFTQQGNELSGVDHCLISGFRQYGIYLAPGASGAPITNCEIYAPTAGATYGIYTRAWLSNSVEHVTSVGDATNIYAAAFMLYNTITSLLVCHAEKTTDGILARNSSGVVISFQGHSTVTNVVHMGTDAGGMILQDIAQNGATTTVLDDNVGYSLTGAVRFLTQNFLRIGKALVRSGAGSPEASVTANVGSLYLRNDGGAATTLYVKESGTGNTGWVAK